jgi:NAD(P)H-hydrate epimerase
VVIGPGIPCGPETGELVRAFLARVRIPAVVDADGLNAIADDTAFLRELQAPAVLTPHPGEMGRLTRRSAAEIQEDRIGFAIEAARGWRSVVVLKGARTVVADPEGSAALVPTGNAGLATGGTGDVLAGLVGALIAGGIGPASAARAAAWVHGRAGDLAAVRFGQRGLLATDVADAIGAVWAEWKR